MTFPGILFTPHVSFFTFLLRLVKSPFFGFWVLFSFVGSLFLVGYKLPPTSVSDEVLEDRRKYEEGKTEELLSKYKAFCGKVWLFHFIFFNGDQFGNLFIFHYFDEFGDRWKLKLWKFEKMISLCINWC